MMAGQALQNQTSQAPKDLELRFYWNIRGKFCDHEEGRLFVACEAGIRSIKGSALPAGRQGRQV
jgi:hypothetical protein